MPIFRFHRGSLEDSLETAFYVKDKKDLARKISHFNHLTNAPTKDSDMAKVGVHCDPSELTIKPYIFDERIGWDTHLVVMNPRCVTQDAYIIGFLSENFTDEK